MAKVSVIIPVYNVEYVVGACIESVLRQTYDDLELLLIDDGSIDRSREVCQKYAEQDARVFVWHIQNGGPGAARNFGIEKASGEWICFVDSDDLIDPAYLESFFKMEIPKKNTLVIQGISIVDVETGKEKRRIAYPDLSFVIRDDSNEIAKHRLFHSGYPVSKLYNRLIILEAGLRFSTEFSYHEDHVFFWQYLPYVQKVNLSSYVGYKYLVREGSLSSSHPPYQKMLKAYLALRQAQSTLPRVSNQEYVDSVGYFIFKAYVKSLLFAYQQTSEQRELRRVLHVIDEERCMLRYFRADSLKYKLLLGILGRFSIELQHIILSVYARLLKA